MELGTAGRMTADGGIKFLLKRSPLKSRRPHDHVAMGRPKRRTIERRVRLSESVIWALQRKFYEDMGVAAWAEGGPVPFDVTTNSHIAHRYAQVAVSLMESIVAKRASASVSIREAEPLHVVELGAGHVSLSPPHTRC